METLCVIGIIACVAGLLFPTFAQARRSAYTTSGLSNVRSAGLGIALYAGDYDDYFPYGVDDQAKSFPWLWGPYENLVPQLPLYTDLVAPYVGSRQVFSHPLDIGMNRSENGGMSYVRKPSLFAAVGSSFLYNVDLSLRQGTASSEGVAGLPVLQSAAGFWACGCSEIPDGWSSPGRDPEFADQYRYVVALGDGSARTMGYWALHQPIPSP